MPAAAVHSILLKKENVHDDAIYCCAWTKTNTTGDSRAQMTDFILTGGLDSLIKVWRLENNKLELLHTLEGHCMAVVSLSVSPDGFTLASSSLDCTLIIWDMIAGCKVHEIQTGATDLWQVAFSPDGCKVVASTQSGKLMVFGIEKGEVERVLDTRGMFVLSVAWSPNGKYIASGDMAGMVCIFDVAQGKLTHTIQAHTKDVRSITFTPKSNSVVTASNDGKVKVFDVASAGEQGSLSVSAESWAVCARVAADGARLAAAASDGRVLVAALDTLTPLHTFTEHTDTVWGLQFNAEGDKLLSVSKDKSINIYECPIVTVSKNNDKKEPILIK